MAKQSIQLVDTETGNVFTLKTINDVLASDYTLILPETNGTLAVLKDVENLKDQLKAGDVIVKNSTQFDGKASSEYADKNLSNVVLPQSTINTLRGYTGSKGDTGYVGSVGATGQGFKITAIFNSVVELLGDVTTNDTFGLVAGTLPQTDPDYGKLYHYLNGSWTFITDMSIQGVSGIQGPQGIAGYTGSQGIQGIQGPQGIQGIIGYVGSVGASGAQGPQGIQGIEGPIGYTGSKGDTGFNGSTGAQGIQGPQGIQGIAGYTGSAGTNGTVSTSTPSGGVNGDTWFQY